MAFEIRYVWAFLVLAMLLAMTAGQTTAEVGAEPEGGKPEAEGGANGLQSSLTMMFLSAAAYALFR